MPKTYTAVAGTGKVEVPNDKFYLISVTNSLFNRDGAAIVIHAAPDTHSTKPGDDARIADDVIAR